MAMGSCMSVRQSLLPPDRMPRLKYEYCMILRVRAPSWKDAVLSRFVSDDKRMQEGRDKAEEVMSRLRDAGLKLRVKKYMGRDGAKLLVVFMTADTRTEFKTTRAVKRTPKNFFPTAFIISKSISDDWRSSLISTSGFKL